MLLRSLLPLESETIDTNLIDPISLLGSINRSRSLSETKYRTDTRTGMEDVGAAAAIPPAVPTQPAEMAPLPPPPPPATPPKRPKEQEVPESPSFVDDCTGVVPRENIHVAIRQGQHEEQEEEELASPVPVQAFNLSGELVPAIAAGASLEADTPNYYDWQDLFPELRCLVDGISEITAECKRVAAWKAWPEKHYDEGGAQDWKVFIRRLYIITRKVLLLLGASSENGGLAKCCIV